MAVDRSEMKRSLGALLKEEAIRAGLIQIRPKGKGEDAMELYLRYMMVGGRASDQSLDDWLDGKAEPKAWDLHFLIVAINSALEEGGLEAKLQVPFPRLTADDGTPAEVVGINSARHNRPMPPSLRPETDLSAA